MTAPVPPPVDSPAGWRVLAGCCVIALFGVSALYGSTFGLFLLPLEKDLGWSRGAIAFSLTLATLVGPLAMPLVGWVVDNIPLRPLVLWGIVLQSLNFAAYAFMSGSVWVYYGLSLLLIVTASGASLITLAKVLQNWFEHSLGKALGILFAATAVGGIVHPQWVGFVMAHASWREAFLVMGAASLLASGAAAFLTVRERVPGQRAASAASSARLGDNFAMREFLTDRTWWALAIWNALFSFGVGAVMLHFAALLQGRGLSLAQAASMLSVMGAGGFAGNLLAGWLIDRFPATHLARAFVLAPLGAIVLLYFGHGLAAAAVAAAMLGIFSSGDHALSVFLARRYFAPAVFGRASATQMMATSFGGGISPWISGLVFDRTGSYDVSLMMAGTAFVLATVAAWLLPQPAPERRTAAPIAATT